jgi:cytoskeletal protein CcmA (bactofilin family)
MLGVPCHIPETVGEDYEMWKRDEAVRQPTQPAVPTNEAAAAAPAAAAQAVRPETMRSQNSRDVVNIGKSVVIKGELNGSEDLTIEGHVEGKIELRDHVLTIGPNGKIKAELFAKSVVVLGEVVGNVSASEKVDIRENGSVDGDITSPRVAIAEGAHFRGSVDMAQKGKAAAGPRPAEAKPQPVPPPQPVAQQQPQQAQKVG